MKVFHIRHRIFFVLLQVIKRLQQCKLNIDEFVQKPLTFVEVVNGAILNNSTSNFDIDNT